MTGTLELHPGESTVFDFDFGKFAEILGGDSIASVIGVTKESVSGADTLVISDVTFSGNKVQFRLSDATDGDQYLIEATVVTTDSNTLVGCGKLKVRGCA